MRRINTFSFFLLAKSLAAVEALSQTGLTYENGFLPLMSARMAVNTLLASNELPLRTCRHAAQRLVGAINEIVPEDISEAFKRDRAESVNWWHLEQVKDAVKKFETVLAEELNISDTYAIAQKGAYSTPELISNGEVLFSKEVRSKLPPRAIKDIQEATKCLAFETPTASAFHIVRAIESVIIAYYEKCLGRAPGTRMRNWGVYIRTLRDSGKADSKILDFLDHIRENYRNPVSHPEATLTTDEVVVLLGVAVGAMTQMALAL